MINNIAVFLDRDGVLNRDEKGYVYRIEDFELLPGVIEGLKKLQNRYLLIIVTNQSGIGKGIYSLEDYKFFRNYMHEKLKKEGIKFEAAVLPLIALNARGSLRDAESLLDKCISFTAQDKLISLKEVKDLLGIVEISQISKLIDFIISKN